jgi:hypothetical protein
MRESKTDQNLFARAFMVKAGERSTMPEQFENPNATKLENDTVSSESPEKAIERIAEEAAQKSTLREKKFDTDHKIFSK